MSAIHLFCLGFTFFVFQNAYAQETYKVSYVYDGDTVQISHAQNKFKLRLSEIDAPERNQPYGLKARRALIKLCQAENTQVSVEIVGTDKYARQLGKLNCNGTDASQYLLENGYGWYQGKFARDPILKQAVAQARQNKIGLWQEAEPTPPWLWRKHNLEIESNP